MSPLSHLIHHEGNHFMTKTLQLQLCEVDMIAYANEKQPVCSFYYDDSIDSDMPVKRARTIVHRVNVHEQMLKALEFAQSAIDEAAEIMHYEGGLPVTGLESYEIERAYFALAGITANVREAIRDGRSYASSTKERKRS
jgi:hypothetical protein